MTIVCDEAGGIGLALTFKTFVEVSAVLSRNLNPLIDTQFRVFHTRRKMSFSFALDEGLQMTKSIGRCASCSLAPALRGEG